MRKPFKNDAESLPGGLRKRYSDGVHWWTRNKQQPSKSIYAVCIQHHRCKVDVSAFKVVGRLGSRVGKMDCGVRDRARKWLVRDETDPKVLRTVFEYARLSHMNLMCDAHWFGIRASSEDEAKSHPDVMFVLSHIAHYHVSHTFRGIYFISNGKGAVKIGRATSSLATRLSALQIGSPDPLTVVAAIAATDALALERRLHKLHAGLLIRGEWFSMSDAQALEIALSHGGREWTADALPEDSWMEVIQ